MAQSNEPPEDEAVQTDSGAPDSSIVAACTVVGIGASAGGFEAFGELLNALPNDTGMAFVLVQHLDPDHRSLLVELLRPHTSMRVEEARDRVAPAEA